MRISRWVWVAWAAGTLALPARADVSDVADGGSFRVYEGDRAVGIENFSIVIAHDSLIVTAHVVQPERGPSGRDTLEKFMTLVARLSDSELLNYESTQRYLDRRLMRGLVLHDTVFTSYLQVGDFGEGRRQVRPPGRVYVIDSQIFVLYDLICRNLHGKTFESRPLNLYYLLGTDDYPDTMMVATAADMGTETIRWGARPVQARKIKISDPDLEFFLWMSPRGHMLRLEEPRTRVRVERAAPEVRGTSQSGG